MEPWKCEGCGEHRKICRCVKKPRARFCWECGRKLYGNHFVEMEVDEHERILHKACAEDLTNNKGE